jgi:hypothetical protein
LEQVVAVVEVAVLVLVTIVLQAQEVERVLLLLDL